MKSSAKVIRLNSTRYVAKFFASACVERFGLSSVKNADSTRWNTLFAFGYLIERPVLTSYNTQYDA